MSQKKALSIVSRISSYLNDKKNRPVILFGIIIVFLLVGFTLLYFNQQRKIDALEDKVTDIKKDSRMEKKKKISPKSLSPSPSSQETNNVLNTNQAQQVQNQYQQDSQKKAFQENVTCAYMTNLAETYVNNEKAMVSLTLDEISTVPVTVEIVGSNQSQMETVGSATISPGKDRWIGYVNTKPYMTNLSTRGSCSSPAPGDGTYLVRTESTDVEDIDPNNLPTPKQSTREFEDAVRACVAEKTIGEQGEILRQQCADELGYDVNSTIEEEQTQISDCRVEKVGSINQDCNAQYEHLR
jgi:hypothetical protein